MDAYLTMSQFFVNRLRDKIYEYEYRHGEKPKFIFATQRAYLILEKYAIDFSFLKQCGEYIARFGGIEIRLVSGDGYEVFLSGEPIALRE